MNRRDILKYLGLSPLLAFLRPAEAAPAAVDMALGKDWSATAYSYVSHQYLLTTDGEELIKVMLTNSRYCGATNADGYQGFPPGALRIVELAVSAKPNRIGTVRFETEYLQEHPVPATEFAEIARTIREMSRQPFSGLPTGTFVELEDRRQFRTVLVDQQGRRIPTAFG